MGKSVRVSKAKFVTDSDWGLDRKELKCSATAVLEATDYYFSTVLPLEDVCNIRKQAISSDVSIPYCVAKYG